MKEKKMQDKIDKADKVMEDLFMATNQVYEKFVDCDKSFAGLNNDDLKVLIKFIVKIEKKPKDNVSKHKNATLMKARLAECKPCWTKYFAPQPAANGIESGADQDGEEGKA